MKKIANILLILFAAATICMMLSLSQITISPEVQSTSEPMYTPVAGTVHRGGLVFELPSGDIG